MGSCLRGCKGFAGVGGAWPDVDASLISSLKTTSERGGLGYMVMSEGSWFFSRLPIMWLRMWVWLSTHSLRGCMTLGHRSAHNFLGKVSQ